MGQTVHAFIEHRLTLEEILRLPEHLQHISDNTLSGQWHWTTPNMAKQILTDLWTRKAEYFINNAYNKENLALLEKENLTLHFTPPILVTFENSLRWNIYKSNGQLRKEFNLLT